MNKLFLVLLVLTGTAFAGEWEFRTLTDSMTDEVVKQAEVKSAEGDVFTVLRRSDGSAWGYVRLAGHKQFGVKESIMIRVDKNKPFEFNDEFEKLTKRLGKPIKAWEWSPTLVGFRIWHGIPAEGCGIVEQLFKGEQMIVRYHPTESTYREITFALTGNADAITDALGFSISDCKV